MDLDNSQEVHLSHYWNIIYKRWKIAVAILAVVMAGTFLASYLSKPLYLSKVQIQVERENPNQMTVEDLFGIEINDQDFMQTQYVLLKSRGLADRVIREHSLLNDPDFYPAGVKGKTPAEIDRIRDSMIGSIIGNLEVAPVRGTSLVDISYIAPTPRLAQKMAEAVADSYMRQNVENKLDAVRQASEFLTRQIAQVKNEMDSAQEELNKYGETKDIISTADASNVTIVKLNQLNADFTAAQNDRMQKTAGWDAINRAGPEAIAGLRQLRVGELHVGVRRLELLIRRAQRLMCSRSMVCLSFA